MKKTEQKNIGVTNSTMIGQALQEYCWEFIITKDTYYTIQEWSNEAQAYKDKIIHWIWKNGIYLEKDWQTVENEIELAKVQAVFKDTTRNNFKDKYFTNFFCSGDIFLYPRQNLLWEITCQVVDSRTMIKLWDKFGTITWYKQMSGWMAKDISLDSIYNSIVRFDPSNPLYGKSIYKTVVYDALSDNESAKRQFYFFRNAAVPNALFMLDPLQTNPETLKSIKSDLKEKFGWSSNAHKSIVSTAIKDVKILELSNKDLDLINLRKFIILKMAILFQIDPRMIWYMSDAGADRSITSIREEAKETINNRWMTFEDDINNFYKMFIDKNIPYRIKLNNETFQERDTIETAQRQDVQLWLITINEVRKERWLEAFPETEADKPMIWSNMTFLDQVTQQFIP